MTHSLHRQGTRESLQNDFVFLVDPAKGINDKDVAPKAAKIIAAAVDAGCINWADRNQSGGSILKMDLETIKANLSNETHLRGVFTSKESVIKFLQKYKEIDPGLSLVISGLLTEVVDACDKTGIIPHTINFSLGVFGNKARLAPADILALTTMCGHHLISPDIVNQALGEIRRGAKSAREAALEISKLCPCGLFNQVRAEHLLQQMADET